MREQFCLSPSRWALPMDKNLDFTASNPSRSLQMLICLLQVLFVCLQCPSSLPCFS